MAEKSKSNPSKQDDSKNLTNDPQLKELISKGIIRLLHEKPEKPLLFLAEYFQSQSTSLNKDKTAEAVEILQLSSYKQPVFQSNLMKAFEILSENTKHCITGLLFNEIMVSYCKKYFSDDIFNLINQKFICKSLESVNYSVFSFAFTCCSILFELTKVSENVYKKFISFSNDQAVTVDLTESLIELIADLSVDNTNTVEKEHFSTTIAAFLKNQSDSLKHKNIKEISANEFVYSLCEVFLSKVDLK